MMIKRIAISFLLAVCTPMLLAGYSDGFITAGEYEYGVTWRSYETPLVVDGGGALDISVRDYGRLIVQSTSKPLQRYVSGVYDIILLNGHLLYLDGVTENISIGQNDTATLKGGSINSIKTMRYVVPDNENVLIYAYEDTWSWIDNDPLKGIQGTWLDSGTPFRINFINDFDYGPVWLNVKVIPEPATMLLIGLGGLLIQRKIL
jgi:hypothetical protein